MGLHLEDSEIRIELEAAENAGYIAALADSKSVTGSKTKHSFTTSELISAWEKGYQRGLTEILNENRIVSPMPDELGRKEE